MARAATSTEQAARETAALVDFDAAVFDEMVWAAMMSVIRTIDAPTELIATFLGSDPTTDFAEVTARTDRLATAADQIGVLDDLAAARTTDIDLREMVERYQAVIDPIRATLETLGSGDIEVISAALTDDDELRRTLAPATFRKRLERALARLRTSWRSRHEPL